MKIPYKPGVYCLKALDSKLIYIGSSKNIGIRINLHRSSIKRKDISRSSKILIDTFSREDMYPEVLELCDNYLEREQYWIDIYKNQDVYTLINNFDADRNNSNISISFREKMSNVLRERWKNPEYREATLRRLKKTQFKSGENGR